MRTITLELLRHGPAHNQLLSPLTPYLALCEDHAAVTLKVKLEHRSLLHQLRALSYQLGEETRQHQLQDSARFLAELLAQVPGLAAELSRSAGDGPSSQPIHLRLVLSASELALLPFELALAPPAWPGAGQPLLLQPRQPMCITRESRRVAGRGASIAHALHQAGIPLVIASQFPLSFGGSVRMVQTLYDGLLWGEDPGAVLVALRRQLHTEFPYTADWASPGATRPSSGTWPRGIPTRPRGWLGVAVPATMIQLRICRLSCFPPSFSSRSNPCLTCSAPIPSRASRCATASRCRR